MDNKKVPSLSEIKKQVIEAFVNRSQDPANPEHPSLALLRRCYLTAQTYRKLNLQPKRNDIVADGIVNSLISRIVELKLMRNTAGGPINVRKELEGCSLALNESEFNHNVSCIMSSQYQATTDRGNRATLADALGYPVDDITALNDAEQRLLGTATGLLNQFIDEQLTVLGLGGGKQKSFVAAHALRKTAAGESKGPNA